MDFDDDINSIEIIPGQALGTTAWSEVRVIGCRGRRLLATAIGHGGRRYFVKGAAPGVDAAAEILRLRKEFELGIRLDHPSIVHTVSFESVPGLGQCLVTEFIDGVTLGKWLESEAASDKRKRLDVMRQVVDAVAYMHSCGVCHRDLKPDNIMITRRDNRAKIIDLGLGDADDFAIFKPSAGTRRYGAPEQRSSDTYTDVHTPADIYSLGQIMSEMKIGYKRLADRCMSVEPSRRPSAAEVRRGLERRRLWPWLVPAAGVVAATAILLNVPKPAASSAAPAKVDKVAPADKDGIALTAGQPAETVPTPTQVWTARKQPVLTEPSTPKLSDVDIIYGRAKARIDSCFGVCESALPNTSKYDNGPMGILHADIFSTADDMRRQLVAAGMSSLGADSLYAGLILSIQSRLQSLGNRYANR